MKTILTGMLIIIIHSFGLFMFAKGQGELRKFNNEISDHRRLAESYKQYYQNRFQTSISSPSDSNVTVVGRWAWGACQDVEVIGDYAYIGNGGLFQVLNISTPSAPDIAGEVLMPERVVSELEISGNYAYVLNPFSVIDISDPTNPQVVFSQLVGYGAMELTPEGDFLYIGDFPGFIYIFDITNPLQPVQVGWMRASGEGITAIVIEEPYLYVQSSDGLVIDIFDISHKNNPVLIYQYFTAGVGGGLAIKDHYLYFGTSVHPRFQILEVSDPLNPQYIGGLDFPTTIPTAITIEDTTAFVTTSHGEEAGGDFYTLNISDKTNPFEINRIDRDSLNQGYPYALFKNQVIDSNLACIAEQTGLWIVDIQQLDSLQTISFFRTNWSSFRAALQDDFVYIASGFAGLKIIEVRNPTEPQLAGYFDIPQFVADIVVAQNLAYLLSTSRLTILDITNPQNPTRIGQISLVTKTPGGGKLTLAKSGGRIFVSQPGKQIKIIEVSDPYQPLIMDSISTVYSPYDMAILGNYLYVAESDSGVQIYDISLSPPVNVASIETVPARGVCVRDSLLYVGPGGGVSIFNITDPISPIEKGFVNLPGGGATYVDLTFGNSFLYVGYNLYFEMIDVSDPADPHIAGYRRGYQASGPAARDNLIFLPTGGLGLTVLRNELITSIGTDNHVRVIPQFKLHQNFPNPFNVETVISYQIAQLSHVQLNIYNILGQKIKTLVNEVQEQGAHEITLDGTGLSSGIYFYELKTGKFREVKSALLIK